MTVTTEQLGRRAAACKAWEWIAGAKTVEGNRVTNVYTSEIEYDNDFSCYPEGMSAPDLSDRATLALLRDIVARAYGGEQCTVHVFRQSGTALITITAFDATSVFSDVYWVGPEFPVAEALVCVLEAAPEVAP